MGNNNIWFGWFFTCPEIQKKKGYSEDYFRFMVCRWVLYNNKKKKLYADNISNMECRNIDVEYLSFEM